MNRFRNGNNFNTHEFEQYKCQVARILLNEKMQQTTINEETINEQTINEQTINEQTINEQIVVENVVNLLNEDIVVEINNNDSINLTENEVVVTKTYVQSEIDRIENNITKIVDV